MYSTTNKIAKRLLVVALLFGSFATYAQLIITAEVRPRFEFRNGFKTLRPEGDDFKPAAFVEQRTRFYFTYKKDKLKIHIVPQDIRMWGNHDQIYKTDNYNMFNIYEGYGEYWFAEKWAFKVGRQALDYDNARFFGNLDWAQQGRSHDALLFKFNNQNGLIADIGIALNNSGTEPAYLQDQLYMMNNYKNMQFIYLQKKTEKAAYSLIIQNNGAQSTLDSATANDVYYSQTFGLTGKGNISDNFSIAGEVFYQMGKTSTNIDLAAYMASLSFTYKTNLTPITIGVDYLSGTEKGAEEVTSFNPMFGTNHKFYGFMDYFYVGNAHGQEGRITGLTDIFLKTKFKLNEKNFLSAHFHAFSSPVDVFEVNPDGTLSETAYSNSLGSEIDLVWLFKISPDIKMNVGYSHMIATETMEAIKGFNGSKDVINNWAWVMIQIKPEIFNSKKD